MQDHYLKIKVFIKIKLGFVHYTEKHILSTSDLQLEIRIVGHIYPKYENFLFYLLPSQHEYGGLLFLAF